jgi:hypothetical protein
MEDVRLSFEAYTKREQAAFLVIGLISLDALVVLSWTTNPLHLVW